MTPLVLTLALVLQQLTAQRPSTNAMDSGQAVTRQAIMDVGRGVAEVRIAHDQLRRAVFNFGDARVIESARQMQQRCRELTTIVQSATGKVCRSCWGATAQRAINSYRAGLPSVGRLGARCVNQITRDLRAANAAAAVRASIRTVGQMITDGLVPYEAKILDVRRALGLVAQPAQLGAPRR
jgi:hypothetical protein